MAKMSALELEREKLLQTYADTQHHESEVDANEHHSRHQSLKVTEIRQVEPSTSAESSQHRSLPSRPAHPPDAIDRYSTALNVVKKLHEKRQSAQTLVSSRRLPSPPTARPLDVQAASTTALKVVRKLQEKKKLAQAELERHLAENQSHLNHTRERVKSLDTRPDADDDGAAIDAKSLETRPVADKAAAIDEHALMLQSSYKVESESLKASTHAKEVHAKTKLHDRVRRKSVELQGNELDDNQ
jgi:hypothetical protein